MPEDIQPILDAVVELWNTGNADVAKRLYSEGAQRSDPNQSDPAQGSQAIALYVAQVRIGYPDFRLEIKEKVFQDNQLITHWACTGTHKGEFQGIPPTGERINIDGVAWAKIQNGKVIEERVYFDRLLMLEQLGVAPGPADRRASGAAS